MAIFQSVGNFLRGAYNTVKSTVGSAFGRGGSSQQANVMNFNVGSALNNYGQPPKPTSVVGGTTYYNNYTPASAQLSGPITNQYGGVGSAPYGPLPVTISAGPQRIGGGGGGGGTSSYTSPFFTPLQQFPRTISASNLESGNAGFSAASASGAQGAPVSAPLSLPSSLVSVNPGRNDNTKLAGALSGFYTRNADGTYTEVEEAPEETDQQTIDRYKSIAEQLGVKPSVEADPEVIAARNERQRIREALKAPTNELNAVIAKQTSDLLAHRKMISEAGGTETGFGGVEAAINYNAAIRALPLQASIAVLQGELGIAQDYLTELRQIKSEQINNQYEYNSKLLSAIIPALEKKDQRASEAVKTRNDRAYQEQRDNILAQDAWSRIAVQNGQSNLVRSINNLDPSSPDFRSRLGELTSGMVSSSAALDKVQLQNAQLQGEKLRQEIEAGKTVTGEYASVINGAAGLVPATKRQQTKQNIASAISSGNYANAYAEIANAVSDGITGTNKTKFDDARTDVNIMAGMRNAIQEYAAGGGNLGLLKGTEEQIKRKLGVDSGKASALATQLWREFQYYRSNMTGAAFTPAESRDYASVNPTLGKSLDLNLNVIDGAMNQLANRITSTVNARIPDAQKIYDLANGTSNQGISATEGDIKVYGGVTYKVINGVWTPQ